MILFFPSSQFPACFNTSCVLCSEFSDTLLELLLFIFTGIIHLTGHTLNENNSHNGDAFTGAVGPTPGEMSLSLCNNSYYKTGLVSLMFF